MISRSSRSDKRCAASPSTGRPGDAASPLIRATAAWIVLVGATTACESSRETGHLATRVDDACRTWVWDLEQAVLRYEQYAASHTTLDTADAQQLPYGRTEYERRLVLPRLSDQLLLCRRVRREATPGQMRDLDVEDARAASKFGHSENPKTVASGLRAMHEAAKKANALSLRDD